MRQAGNFVGSVEVNLNKKGKVKTDERFL